MLSDVLLHLIILQNFPSLFKLPILSPPFFTLGWDLTSHFIEAKQWAESPLLSCLYISLPHQSQGLSSLLLLRMKLTVPTRGWFLNLCSGSHPLSSFQDVFLCVLSLLHHRSFTFHWIISISTKTGSIIKLTNKQDLLGSLLSANIPVGAGWCRSCQGKRWCLGF